jgi:hypothetical protein
MDGALPHCMGGWTEPRAITNIGLDKHKDWPVGHLAEAILRSPTRERSIVWV